MVVWWWWLWWIDEVCETRGGGGGKAEERRGRAGRSGAKPPLRSDKQSLRKRQPCLCSLELTSVTSEVTERRHFFSLEKIYQFHEQVSRGASLRFRRVARTFSPSSSLANDRTTTKGFGEEREGCSSQNYATLWDVISRVYSFFSTR